MTLPVSNDLSFNAINVELGRTATAQLSIDDSAVRTLFGIASGDIDINTGHGKSNRMVSYFVFSSNSSNATADLIAGTPGYIAGKTDFVITVNPGVYLYAPDDTGYGLLINGYGLASGDTVRLINQGYIMGSGGEGGYGATFSLQRAGGPGGDGTTALDVYCDITIDNTYAGAYIGGGGGGGGGGGCSANGGKGGGFNGGGGGGGAGGGAGGYNGNGGNAGGAGGAIGQAGSQGDGGYFGPGNGAYAEGGGAGGAGANLFGGGGGGGRIFPGIGGSVPSAGGSANNAGATQNFTSNSGGGGGGWGAAGGNGDSGGGAAPGAGGAGGRAVNLNGHTVTWVSGDTSRIYGAVS